MYGNEIKTMDNIIWTKGYSNKNMHERGKLKDLAVSGSRLNLF